MSEIKKKTPPNKQAYDAKYIKENIIQRTLSFNRGDPEDMEMYEWIKSKGRGNGTPYIKGLIREDMKRSGK